MSENVLFWIGFHLLIFFLLWIDLKVLHKNPHEVRFKEAVYLSIGWVALSLAFNLFVYLYKGPELGLQFFTGYLVEKSLSMDNLFVFLLIFSRFKVPSVYQHKVLFWGILGALILRITLILSGVALLHHFHWLTYILGIFLCFTGVKVMVQKETKIDPEKSLLIRWFRKVFPVTEKKGKGDFFIKERGKWKMTSLFMSLLMVEGTDVIFALDSIPAIFAISKDPFIIYTSNIFALLGLRSLYFALSHSLEKLRYFKMGLSALLTFIGLKMVFAAFIDIPLKLSLFVIFAILTVTVLASLLNPQKARKSD